MFIYNNSHYVPVKSINHFPGNNCKMLIFSLLLWNTRTEYFTKNQLASSMHLLTNTFGKFDYYWWLMCGHIFIICKNILSWIKLKNISAKMFLPRVSWRRGILHAGALEDPGGQVRVRDHLRARGVRGLQAHRHPRPRHPRLPRHQDQEGAVPGQGGPSGTKIRHGSDVWQTFYNAMLYLYHARLLLV